MTDKLKGFLELPQMKKLIEFTKKSKTSCGIKAGEVLTTVVQSHRR